jgi:hypothetical protein
MALDLAACEAQRDAEAQAARTEAQAAMAEAQAARAAEMELRAELAVRTAATYRMHEQWVNGAAEQKSLRAELQRAEGELVSARAAADSELRAGMRRSEERVRQAERTRSFELRLLRGEVLAQEGELMAQVEAPLRLGLA